FYKQYGIASEAPRVKIDPDTTLTNAFWDGSRVYFGMGMVNSDFFGPYDSSIVFHETTHSLFGHKLNFEGESAVVLESLCDVIAVHISDDGGWTIGKVRNPGGEPQVLRSLKAPGTAYNLPTLGKDSQVDYLSEVKDLSNVQHHTGFLNK